MRRAEKSALVGVAVGLGLLFFASQEQSQPVSTSKPKRPGDDDTDDETALARMLESETDSSDARTVVGWITLQRAQKLGQSVFRMLTAPQGRYGPRVLDGVSRYADTRRPPTPKSRAQAAALLDGVLMPSQAIRAHGLSPWVEQLKPTAGYALGVLRAQDTPKGDGFGGIWGRIAGTRWFLYGRNIAVRPYSAQTAESVLASVPAFPAVDRI